MTSVSRHYRDSHLNVDNLEMRIAIYEDQVRGWFFDQARALEKLSDHAGFVLLLIVLSYVEGHAIFYKGQDSRRKSRQFFRDAFKSIFPLPDVDQEITNMAIDALYDQMRNGLFHTGMVRGRVVLSHEFPQVVQLVVDPSSKTVVQINANPHKMLDTVEEHFSHYLMRLRNKEETELRKNFDQAWTLRTT